MTSRDFLLSAIEKDVAIIKHLFTKIPEGSLTWRPRPDMRSTIDLLQYLSFIGIAMVENYVRPSADQDENMHRLMAYSANSSSLRAEQFPEAMDNEFARMKALIEQVPDEELLTRVTQHPWGGDVIMFDALLNYVLKYFTAYRHQLFLYARQCGAKINTSDNWRGVESRPAVALVEQGS